MHAKGDGAHGLWAILEIPGSEELVHQRKETEDANDRHGKELLKLVIPSTPNIYTCLKQQSQHLTRENGSHFPPRQPVYHQWPDTSS